MSPTNHHKYKYFHSPVQQAKDRLQKFHFCRLPFDVRPRNVKLNLSKDCVGLSSTVFKICGQQSVNVSYNLRSEVRCMQAVICSLQSAVCKCQTPFVEPRNRLTRHFGF